MKSCAAALVLLGLVTLGWTRGAWLEMDEADKELPPWIQYYNKLKGSPKLLPWQQDEPESLNVRCVGKWGRGPAARVTGRDSLVYLALGSEVAVFNCINASNPRIINEIQCRYVVDRPILVDTILYAVLQGGVEVFNVADPVRAFRIRYLPISAVDMCIRDSLAYTIDADSFKVYRILSPDSFARVGAVADSGYYIFADQGFAYLCDRWGIYIVDATNPANPRRATTLTGAQGGAAWVEDGYCYCTTTNPGSAFVVANVTDPYHPTEVGRRDGLASYELYKLDGYVYMPNFAILEVFNPSQPGLVSTLALPEGSGAGVWTRSPYSRSFVAATYGGMAAIDITDPVNPVLDTMLAAADEARDICTVGDIAYMAAYYVGMKAIDVAQPASPHQIGTYDSIGRAPRAYGLDARDSFAFLLTRVSPTSDFRVIDVTDPTNLRLAATCGAHNGGVAIQIRDSLAYVAEDYWFHIYSIANPRAPRLVGSCGLPNRSHGLTVHGALACVANSNSGLVVVDVADPGRPSVLGSCAIPAAYGVAVLDTFAYVASLYDSVIIVSIGDPATPVRAGAIPGHGWCYDVAISNGKLYVGCFDLVAFDLSDAQAPREIGYHTTPYRVRRVCCDDSLVYAACFGAGIGIYELVASGVEEAPRQKRLAAMRLQCSPNPTGGAVRIEISGGRAGSSRISVYDAAGRRLRSIRVSSEGTGPRAVEADMSGLPRGTYVVALDGTDCRESVMLINR